PPPVIYAHLGTLNGFLRQLSQSGRARSGILLIKEFLRKSAKIVNGGGMIHSRNQGSFRLPVGGNTENRVRSGQYMPCFCPVAAILVVFDGVHWTAMTNKKCGHSLVRMWECLLEFLKCAVE